MSDRPAATAGFVVAGLVVATALGSSPAETPRLVTLGAAVAATLAFLSGRYGLASRRLAAPVAAAGSVGIVAGGLATIPDVDGILLPGIVVLLGSCAFALAWADLQGTPRDRLADQARSAALGGLIAVAGILTTVVWYSLLLSFEGVVSIPGERNLLSTVAGGLGFVTVTACYVAWVVADRSFIDLRLPDRLEWGYVALGSVLILAANAGSTALIEWLGVESTDHTIFVEAQNNPEILLIFIPLSYLVVAPSEELLYRNVIQKSLRDYYSRYGTVIVATVIFAATHFSAFNTDGSTLALLATLGAVFLTSLVLGAVYELTGNLTVSILVHGTNNAVAFAVTYAEIVGLLG